ncbi:hypothetical protein GCM10010168_36370 [Actinoplanes ianthinogenes]|uniref:Uncharacterized protein n=1 Tax=Actinoplanes ianthinogenes TaxID=122358 RepID=A0ABM7M5C0_9ACTN|nr:hypothetical protein Aiant_74980 [Actinoplanes ianthinogenes]GGR15150.1 hypothetical protein GCM10010168_36370 [Actinoplanes ianthinogenes]
MAARDHDLSPATFMTMCVANTIPAFPDPGFSPAVAGRSAGGAGVAGSHGESAQAYKIGFCDDGRRKGCGGRDQKRSDITSGQIRGISRTS